ncbi:FlgN protein [Leptospira ryugenii]|uniref:FlgN protein n=1 Tax=Leptospira ryugenii TaxID=1917863 RepID=A0A2P2E3V8_9LEPT|nr:flagellar export chaperone FlgN [Leptospira ryugenii]GBF51561.1 FlgN protein [Leptospira ryugenii]
MSDWVESLRDLFTKEIDCYKRLLDWEGKKRKAIHEADGKTLESCVKESYHLMVEASEWERIRMKTIQDVYTKENFENGKDSLTLTHFMNQMDRESNYKLKGFAQELRTVVLDLKEAIVVNEKLLRTRNDFLQKTLDTIRESGKEKVYTSSHQPARRTQNQKSAVILNASV